MCTPRASASTSSGCSYSRSIRSRTRRSRARSRRCCVEAAWGLTPAALRKELRDHLLVLRWGVRIGRRPLEHDVDVGLYLRAHRHPGHALVLGVVANLETKDVAVERQGFGVVVDGYKAVRDFQFHLPHVR